MYLQKHDTFRQVLPHRTGFSFRSVRSLQKPPPTESVPSLLFPIFSFSKNHLAVILPLLWQKLSYHIFCPLAILHSNLFDDMFCKFRIVNHDTAFIRRHQNIFIKEKYCLESFVIFSSISTSSTLISPIFAALGGISSCSHAENQHIHILYIFIFKHQRHSHRIIVVRSRKLVLLHVNGPHTIDKMSKTPENIRNVIDVPTVSNLAFLSVKARREHHPMGLFPTIRSDTYE